MAQAPRVPTQDGGTYVAMSQPVLLSSTGVAVHIGLFEDIAPDRRAQIVRGDRPRRMFWGTDITRMTCAGGNASRCSPRNYPG
jgi:hypothetical protein